MTPDRRTLIRLAGLGVVTAVAGCSSATEPDDGDTGNDSSAPNAAIETTDTIPFAATTSRPQWDVDDAVGNVVVIDSDERQRAALDRRELPDARRDAIRTFLSDIEYDRERLLFVESIGPNACHDRLDIDSISLESEELSATATVIDSSADDTACAEVITYPSALARITFAAEPIDAAAVDVTNGWGETATIHANVHDPLGPSIESLEGEVRPDSEATPIEPLECDESGVTRYPQGFDDAELSWGNVDDDGESILGLRIDATDYEYGETARIRLTNVADRTIDTGNSGKYSVQVYTDTGWGDVRVGDEDQFFGYTDEAIRHPPGEGFEWAIELTEAGIEEASPHAHTRVCPDLVPGRYRFVYWGVIGGAVAVSFDVRRD